MQPLGGAPEALLRAVSGRGRGALRDGDGPATLAVPFNRQVEQAAQTATPACLEDPVTAAGPATGATRGCP